jgi:hypothetical protein
MFAAVDNGVSRLTRIAIGPVELGRLHEGGFRRLNPREIERLRGSIRSRTKENHDTAAEKKRRHGTGRNRR